MAHLMSKEEMYAMMEKNLPQGFPSLPEPELPKDKRHGFLAGDPMSPYRIPSTRAFYKSIVEVMNKKGFPAWSPQTYTPISNYFLDSGIPPFHDPGEGENYAKGVLTVANMVELHRMDMPFRLCDENDLDTVIAIAKRYHDAMLTNGAETPKIKEYLKWVESFLIRAEDARTAAYKRKGIINPHTVDIVKVLEAFLR